MRLKKTTAALLALAVVATAGITTAASFGLNPQADAYPETKVTEDRLTVETHDRTNMDWLTYEGDNGKIREVSAHVNGTESGAKVAYRPDRIDAEALGMFPRVGGEENNSVTWLDTSNWSSTSGVSVADTDGETATGVDSVTVSTDGSFTSSSSGSASYGEASITDDAQKRYLQFVANVNGLDSGAEVTVQVRDGDGDYVAATANSSADVTQRGVFANATASGVVFQQQLGQLTVEGSGDGSLNAVEEVRVAVAGGDADVTLTGLNVEKKSRWDFGDQRVLDAETDEEGDYTSEAVYESAGGEILAEDLTGLGDTFSDATLAKLAYLNVQYRMQDDPSSNTVAFEAADQYPNYENKLSVTHRFAVPTAYDLTHGSLALTTEQSFLKDRYLTLRYAEGVGDRVTEDVSSDSWIDLTGSLGEEGTSIEADATVQPDTTYVVQFDALLLEDQYNNLQPTTGSGGFWGSDSGSSNPFMSLYNWIAGGVVGLLSMFGLASRGN